MFLIRYFTSSYSCSTYLVFVGPCLENYSPVNIKWNGIGMFPSFYLLFPVLLEFFSNTMIPNKKRFRIMSLDQLRSSIYKWKAGLCFFQALLAILHVLVFSLFSREPFNQDPLSIYCLIGCFVTGILFWVILSLDASDFWIPSIATLIAGVLAFTIAAYDPFYYLLTILGVILWAVSFSSAYIVRLNGALKKLGK